MLPAENIDHLCQVACAMTTWTVAVAWTTCIICRPSSKPSTPSLKSKRYLSGSSSITRRRRRSTTLDLNRCIPTSSIINDSNNASSPPSPSPSSSSDNNCIPQPSLLTDSVLETKWKNEGRQLSQEQDIDLNNNDSETYSNNFQSSKCEEFCNDDDLSASDPYKAFAKFTRIAAPTIAIGHLPTSTFASSIINEISPYSTGDIACRLLNYTNAQQNITDFLNLFTGDFDNGLQINEERKNGIYAGESGGHEHIHCCIRQINTENNILLATYYFNGDPTKIFRTRIYSLQIREPICERGVIEMRILRLYEENERLLKETNFENLNLLNNNDMYIWLQGCEVFWERYRPSSSSSPNDDDIINDLCISDGDRYVGYMIGGGCELFSKDINGHIKILDDLLLTKNELWVADRGFDSNNKFVYGNRKGIPYKMKRVDNDDINDPLRWTVSRHAKPPQDYIS